VLDVADAVRAVDDLDAIVAGRQRARALSLQRPLGVAQRGLEAAPGERGVGQRDLDQVLAARLVALRHALEREHAGRRLGRVDVARAARRLAEAAGEAGQRSLGEGADRGGHDERCQGQQRGQTRAERVSHRLTGCRRRAGCPR
jgi:hypothetical protein